MSRIIFTNGCFDGGLHPGHIRLLRQARGMGSKLVVGVDSDERVRELKGPLRPLFPAADRMLALRMLRCVDEIYEFGSDAELVELIEGCHADLVVKGADWEGKPVISAGRPVAFVPLVVGYSTTDLILRIREAGWHAALSFAQFSAP